MTPRWHFNSYLATLIERDVLELASIERRGELLKLLAARTSGLLVPGSIAGVSGIPRTTLVRYLELLASVFLVKTIPAWSSGMTQRAIGPPSLPHPISHSGLRKRDSAAKRDKPGPDGSLGEREPAALTGLDGDTSSPGVVR